MTVHLLRIAPGISTVAELAARLDMYAVDDPTLGRMMATSTRNTPKRQQELLDGGSVYWIMKGHIMARAPLLDIRVEEDDEGRRICRLCVAAVPIAVVPTKRRGFQGWRYLPDADVPSDLDKVTTSASEDIPAELASELKDLGLI